MRAMSLNLFRARRGLAGPARGGRGRRLQRHPGHLQHVVLTGRRSLDGTSTAYRDCSESVHGTEPGFTFEPRTPLSAIDEPDLDRGRRIDIEPGSSP